MQCSPTSPFPNIYPAMHPYEQGERSDLNDHPKFIPTSFSQPAKVYDRSTFSNKGNNASNALALPSLLKMTAPALAVLKYDSSEV